MQFRNYFYSKRPCKVPLFNNFRIFFCWISRPKDGQKFPLFRPSYLTWFSGFCQEVLWWDRSISLKAFCWREILPMNLQYGIWFEHLWNWDCKKVGSRSWSQIARTLSNSDRLRRNVKFREQFRAPYIKDFHNRKLIFPSSLWTGRNRLI